MTGINDLVAAAERLAASATWYATSEGKAHMADKAYRPGSVHRSLITDVLHDAIDHKEGDPIGIVYRALMVLFAELGCEGADIEAAITALKPIARGASPES